MPSLTLYLPEIRFSITFLSREEEGGCSPTGEVCPDLDRQEMVTWRFMTPWFWLLQLVLHPTTVDNAFVGLTPILMSGADVE